MPIKQPVQGPGQIQWNKWGWFGCQFGCTAWLLPTGLIFLFKEPSLGIFRLGMIWLAIFAVLNAFGAWLWIRRDRLRPYRAIQWFLAACGVGGLLAIGSVDMLGFRAALPTVSIHDWCLVLDTERNHDLEKAYLYLLLGVPGIMGWFAFQEHAARKAQAKSEAGQATMSQPETT